MYYAIMDKNSNHLKSDQNGQLAIFDTRSQAMKYKKDMVDVDGNGVRIVLVDVKYHNEEDRVK